MRHGTRDRLKGANGRLPQVDQAFEGHAFRFADGLLSIQLRSQRTASYQQHLQTLNQAMTPHAFVLGRRMMQPQSLHLLALAAVASSSHRQ